MKDASLEVESNVLAFNRLEENLTETREEGDLCIRFLYPSPSNG
jgi:hypothetical protein